MHGEASAVDVNDTMWGIYQTIGHSHDDIRSKPEEMKEFIALLRKAADDLESTLTP